MNEWVWMSGVAMAFIVLVSAVVVVLWIQRQRRSSAATRLDLPRVDVTSLDRGGPPASGPQLTLYHQPVRLVLLVLAPVGREGKLPVQQQLPALVESLLPGFMDVLNAHQPQYNAWPSQLSVSGFMRAFGATIVLPGRRGSGTSWSTIAGPFEHEGRRYLAGLVVRAGRDNSLGEIIVDHPGKWLDVLRVQTTRPV